MKSTVWLWPGLVAAGLFVSSTAFAVDDQTTKRGFGTGVFIGGGVTGFTGEELRDVANVGGSWEARVAMGTRSPFGLEAAYIGTAQGIDALGVESDSVLVGTAFEASLRANLLQGGNWTPYALAGLGWRHYEVSGDVTPISNVTSSDDVLETPLGLGVSYRWQSMLLDLRGMFRPAFGSDLLRTEDSLDTWGARLSVGWEL